MSIVVDSKNDCGTSCTGLEAIEAGDVRAAAGEPLRVGRIARRRLELTAGSVRTPPIRPTMPVERSAMGQPRNIRLYRPTAFLKAVPPAPSFQENGTLIINSAGEPIA